MNIPSFDSRNTEYKSPFGAAFSGQKLQLKIMPDHGEYSSVQFVVAKDGCEPQKYDMRFLNNDVGCDVFCCEYTAKEPGLYFYWFELSTEGVIRYICNDNCGAGFPRNEKGRLFQLTVYDAGFKAPDRFKGGVMYQIMPDRFCRQGDIPQNLPSGRIISETWGDLPPQSDENGYCSNYYFGGNFKGITSKLPYLKSLGVTTVYLNPIFEAHSYHRYNTADYSKADPLLGTEDDFRNLCEQGEQAGINIILDGVFSHTGEDSVYFNKYARYPDKGAYESKDSIYYSWYDFKKWPEIYRCWWNFKELPEVNESEPSYLDYITGKDGILQRWIKLGASGWRLDVADELPDNMIESIRNAVKDAGEENIVLGEVWEDASNKISYGQRRHYLEGKQLDSVMNYPWRYAIIDYLRTGNAAFIAEAVMTIIENYPKESLDTLMNHLGTHDTARLITCLAGENPDGKSKSWRQFTRMAPERRQRGLALVRLACAIQFMLPGIPCIYFGDEAGFEGYEDPFNRQCYNWGGEDKALVEWYRALGRLRSCCPVFKTGQYRPIMARGAVYAFERLENGEFVSVAVNAGESAESLEMNGEICVSFGNVTLSGGILTLPPKSCAILGSGSFVSCFEKVNQN